MTVLNGRTEHGIKVSDAGTIASLSAVLFENFRRAGYSLIPSDIESAVIADFQVYAGWADTEMQLQGITAVIDRNYVLSVAEWTILEPVCRAHCEYIQAQRVEALGSVGGERFGLTVSEAKPLFLEAREIMKGEAFFEEPFMIEVF